MVMDSLESWAINILFQSPIASLHRQYRKLYHACPKIHHGFFTFK